MSVAAIIDLYCFEIEELVQSHVVSASVNKRAESWRDRSERAAARPISRGFGLF
jgi:hypothetical protein